MAVFLVSLGVAMAGVAANTTVTYTFNGADQLTQVSSSQSGVLAHFTYDGDNLRATKTVGSATVIYVRGPSGEVIAEYSGSGVLLAEYVYLDGQRVCKITKDGQGVEHRVYYHSDIVGTPVALTDEAGQLIAKAEYLPFGEEVVHGAAPDVHKFTGKELDEEIGLYDFGARYYDARLGRFISVDPVAGTNDDPQSWNRYAYVKNRPTFGVDPDGRIGPISPAYDQMLARAYAQGQKPSPFLGVAAVAGLVVNAAPILAAYAPEMLTYLLMQGPQLAVTATEALNPNPGGFGVPANEVPATLARVIPGDVKPTMLGPAAAKDVFVTAAEDIRGLNAKQLAERLAIDESESFTVVEFATPSTGLASPINRANPGFVGGGRTAGGAREFVLPNQSIPEGATIRKVQ